MKGPPISIGELLDAAERLDADARRLKDDADRALDLATKAVAATGEKRTETAWAAFHAVNRCRDSAHAIQGAD